LSWPPPLRHLGRIDEAQSAVKAGLVLNPAYTIGLARALWTAWSDNPTFLAGVQRIVDGLRTAGAPEQ
jgi:hypothetical protein